MEQTIVILSFQEEGQVYQAQTVLRHLAGTGALTLHSAVVVKRDLDGTLHLQGGPTGREPGLRTTAGGLIGALIGVLGGPLGVLMAGTVGALIGKAGDEHRADERGRMVQELSRAIPSGWTALIARVEEAAPAELDRAAAHLGGQVTRRFAGEVRAELDGPLPPG